MILAVLDVMGNIGLSIVGVGLAYLGLTSILGIALPKRKPKTGPPVGRRAIARAEAEARAERARMTPVEDLVATKKEIRRDENERWRDAWMRIEQERRPHAQQREIAGEIGDFIRLARSREQAEQNKRDLAERLAAQDGGHIPVPHQLRRQDDGVVIVNVAGEVIARYPYLDGPTIGL